MSRPKKIVRWSEKDGCYVGTCPALFLGGVHGRRKRAVSRHLAQVVADWKRLARRKKEPET